MAVEGKHALPGPQVPQHPAAAEIAGVNERAVGVDCQRVHCLLVPGLRVDDLAFIHVPKAPGLVVRGGNQRGAQGVEPYAVYSVLVAWKLWGGGYLLV